MTNIEKIRQEIERRMKTMLSVEGLVTGVADNMRYQGYKSLLAFIDSLPEEKPSEDLEEAAHHIAIEALNDTKFMTTTMGYVLGKLQDIFIAGAKWMREKMKKEEVEVDVADLNGEIYNNCIEKGMTDEDKVKIVIIKGND